MITRPGSGVEKGVGGGRRAFWKGTKCPAVLHMF